MQMKDFKYLDNLIHSGFAEIMDQATRAAEYCRLERQDTLHLQIMTEESRRSS